MINRFIRQIWRSALLSHAMALALISALLAGPWFIATQTIFGIGQLNYGLLQIEQSFVGQLIEKAKAFFEPFGSLIFGDVSANPTKAWIIFTLGLLIWLSFIMRAMTRMHPTGAVNLPGHFFKRWISALNLPIVGLVAAFVVVWALGKMSGPPLDFAQGHFGAVFGILAVISTSVFLFFLYGWLPRWKAGFLVRALISFSIAFVILGLTAASKYAVTLYQLAGLLEQGKFAFVALVSWSFVAWLTVLFGAQLIIFFSAENAMAEVSVSAAQEMDLALASLRELGHLSEDRKWTSSERLSNQTGCKYAAVKQVMSRLEEYRIVKGNGKDSWALVEDLGDVTLKDVGLAMGTYLDSETSLRLGGMDPVTERSLQALSPEWEQDLYSAFRGIAPDLMELDNQGTTLPVASPEVSKRVEEEPDLDLELVEVSEMNAEETETEAFDLNEEIEEEPEVLDTESLELTELQAEKVQENERPPPIPVQTTFASADSADDNTIETEDEIAWFVEEHVVGDRDAQGFSGISSSTAEHPWFRETAVFADNGSEEVEELEPIEPGSLDEIRKAIEAEAQKD